MHSITAVNCRLVAFSSQHRREKGKNGRQRHHLFRAVTCPPHTFVWPQHYKCVYTQHQHMKHACDRVPY